MKQFIIAGLCAALVSAPIQETRSQSTPALICLMIGAVMVGGCMVVYVNTCGPKYYCVTDPDNPGWQWCCPTTKRECQINGWTINHGPFKKHGDCAPVCTNTIGNLFELESPVTIRIESSTNLIQWTECVSFTGDPECFDVAITNQPVTGCFYRAFYR